MNVVLGVAVPAGALQPGRDDEPGGLEPARLAAVDPGAVVAGPGDPAQACRYSSAARLARYSASWNACSRPAQYAAACRSPPWRARRSFSRREACSTEMDLENETVTS